VQGLPWEKITAATLLALIAATEAYTVLNGVNPFHVFTSYLP